MKRFALFGALCLGLLVQVGYSANASAHEKFENLQVLDGSNKKSVEKGMKSFSKGLGVKCNACHVKGDFDSDKVPAKADARKFLKAVVGQKDEAKRKAALADLLKVLKLEKPKAEAKIWKGIDRFKKAKK